MKRPQTNIKDIFQDTKVILPMSKLRIFLALTMAAPLEHP